MNCPKCYEPLRIADRQGIEVDYCPDCRGVWLDKGELDKIIERTLSYAGPPKDRYHEPDESRFHSKSDYKQYKKYNKKYKKKYKKNHIIKEIFDFFD